MPFGEEIFPNIQSKPPVVQPEAISSCPVYLGKETDISPPSSQPLKGLILLLSDRTSLLTAPVLKCRVAHPTFAEKSGS